MAASENRAIDYGTPDEFVQTQTPVSFDEIKRHFDLVHRLCVRQVERERINLLREQKKVGFYGDDIRSYRHFTGHFFVLFLNRGRSLGVYSETRDEIRQMKRIIRLLHSEAKI